MEKKRISSLSSEQIIRVFRSLGEGGGICAKGKQTISICFRQPFLALNWWKSWGREKGRKKELFQGGLKKKQNDGKMLTGELGLAPS